MNYFFFQSCGDFIRKLKQEKATKEAIGLEVKVLLQLKELYKKKTGQEWKATAAPAEPPKEKKEVKPEPVKADGWVKTMDLYDLDRKGKFVFTKSLEHK